MTPTGLQTRAPQRRGSQRLPSEIRPAAPSAQNTSGKNRTAPEGHGSEDRATQGCTLHLSPVIPEKLKGRDSGGVIV